MLYNGGLTTVKLRALFSENRILVHEIMGSALLVESSFIDNVVKNVKFYR